MDKYLPTGNDFVSLPRINERTGGIEDITFLYMAAKGLIDIRGSESTPLIQPYVHLDASVPSLRLILRGPGLMIGCPSLLHSLAALNSKPFTCLLLMNAVCNSDDGS